MSENNDITAPENIVWRGDVEALRRALCDWMYEAAVPLIRSAVKGRALASEPTVLHLSASVLGAGIRLLVNLEFRKGCKTIEQGWRVLSPEIGHHSLRGWRRFCDTASGRLEAKCEIDTDLVKGTICCYTMEKLLYQRKDRTDAAGTLDRPGTPVKRGGPVAGLEDALRR